MNSLIAAIGEAQRAEQAAPDRAAGGADGGRAVPYLRQAVA
jgi:hypothetical protein